jgi:hypothetical protein
MKAFRLKLARVALAMVLLGASLPIFADQANGWSLVSFRKMNAKDSPLKGQGLAFNTTAGEVVFSGNTGLERAALNYDSLGQNMNALKGLPGSANPSHIGCIDIRDNVLYAPVEDGARDPKYQHPLFAQYDPASLAYLKKAVQLNPGPDQDDGVPWVAADDRSLYTSKAYGVTVINVYDRQSIWDLPYPQAPEPVKRVTLSREISKVQCAKVSGGLLYILSDDDEKWLRTVNLNTGEVTDLLKLSDAFQQIGESGEWEAEGVAFFPGLNDSTLHFTAVLRKRTTVQVYVFDYKKI